MCILAHEKTGICARERVGIEIQIIKLKKLFVLNDFFLLLLLLYKLGEFFVLQLM